MEPFSQTTKNKQKWSVLNLCDKWCTNENGDIEELPRRKSKKLSKGHTVDNVRSSNKSELIINTNDLKTENRNSHKLGEVECEKTVSFNKKTDTSGIDGQIFEIDLAIFFLLQGIMKKEASQIDEFYLASNMLEAGSFDDLIFKYVYKHNYEIQEKIILLQAKHKNNPTKPKEKITIDRLLSDAEKKEMFTLKDYFQSYRQIKKTFDENHADVILNSKFKDCEFIIFTNAEPHSQFNENHPNLNKTVLEQDDILIFDNNNNYYYQLRLQGDDKVDQKIKNVLENSSECKQLAKELVKLLFPSHKKNATITLQGIVKHYHVPLAQDVIERKTSNEGVLKKSFLNNGTKNKNFRDTFLDEVEKKVPQFRGKLVDEIISDLQVVNIKLPNGFWEFEGKKCTDLPNDLVTEDEIRQFLRQLKLFISQPNVIQLESILKDQLQSVYKVDPRDIDTTFSDIKNKVAIWWKEDNVFLTESNKIFQQSIQISIWFDIKKPIEIFTGRDRELYDLHNKIQNRSNKSILITGMKGIGKSELIRQYIQEYKSYYNNNVIWINAENEDILTKSFQRLAKDLLKIETEDANGEEKDIEWILEQVYTFFKRRKSLFVFDNANQLCIKSFLPDLNSNDSQLSIIFTSVSKKWERKIETIALTKLPLEDAILLIKKGLEINDNDILQDKEIKILVRKLNCIPLALQQATSYIKYQNNVDDYEIKDFLGEYEEIASDLVNFGKFTNV